MWLAVASTGLRLATMLDMIGDNGRRLGWYTTAVRRLPRNIRMFQTPRLSFRYQLTVARLTFSLQFVAHFLVGRCISRLPSWSQLNPSRCPSSL